MGGAGSLDVAMSLVQDRSVVVDRCRDRHVCWVVDDAAGYAEIAEAILADGAAAGRKTVAFGPVGGESLRALADVAAMAADPRVAFLGGRALDPDAMFSMFREQTALARSEGYEGLCLVADMDWLLAAQPTLDDVVGFELLLDRLIAELGTTVVCAYRRMSFDPEAIAGVLSVHPVSVGDEPEFTLVAADGDTWRLSGEVDLAMEAAFAAAVSRAAEAGPCVVDVADLDFIDIAGMRTIAAVGRRTGQKVVLRNASPTLRRIWHLGRFDDVAPNVELITA